jgi:hypothetical protein
MTSRDSRPEIQYAYVHKPDIGDEYADASAYGILKASWYGFNDMFPDFGYGYENIEKAADKNKRQRMLP